MNKLTIRELKQSIIEKKKSAVSDVICHQYKNDELMKATIKGEIMAYTDVLNMIDRLK